MGLIIRHYIILLSTCILSLIDRIASPLILGIYDQRQLMISCTDTATRSGLYPTDWVSDNLTTRYSHTAFNYALLNGSLPPFTHPAYALLPVHPRDDMAIIQDEEWIADTTLFEAELVCESAVVNTTYDSIYGGFSMDVRSGNVYHLLAT